MAKENEERVGRGKKHKDRILSSEDKVKKRKKQKGDSKEKKSESERKSGKSKTEAREKKDKAVKKAEEVLDRSSDSASPPPAAPDVELRDGLTPGIGLEHNEFRATEVVDHEVPLAETVHMGVFDGRDAERSANEKAERKIKRGKKKKKQDLLEDGEEKPGDHGGETFVAPSVQSHAAADGIRDPETVATHTETKAASTVVSTETPLFFIDLNPTKIAPEALRIQPALPPHSGSESKQQVKLNRAARRRLALIERQRVKICKELGVAEDSADKTDEVAAMLAAWTEKRDGQTAAREEKKKAKKEREAHRLRSKKGKLLTGRKLAEKEKDIARREKKLGKRLQQISRQ